MAYQYKMALILLLAAITLGRRGRHHHRDDDNAVLGKLSRREWQYEGMPVEAMMRRHAAKKHRSSTPARTIVESTTRTTVAGSTEMAKTTKTTMQKTTTPKATTTKATTTRVPTTITEPAPALPPLSKRYRRIYNADETARIEDHPYLAAILMNNQLWCGGAIISSDLVLTAAHCLQLQYNNRFFREYVKMLSVRIGSSNATAGGELLSVGELFFHPNYKPQTLAFNYAVLRLRKNITFWANVSKIEYSRRRDVTIDKTITFLGWGSVLGMGDKGGAVLLQKVKLPIYDKADCADVYGRELVSVSTFCAGYISKIKNVCNHDAGGPAIMDGELIGVLSFSAKRCDEADKPAVFAGTGAAAEWLDTIPDIQRKRPHPVYGIGYLALTKLNNFSLFGTSNHGILVGALSPSHIAPEELVNGWMNDV